MRWYRNGGKLQALAALVAKLTAGGIMLLTLRTRQAQWLPTLIAESGCDQVFKLTVGALHL